MEAVISNKKLSPTLEDKAECCKDVSTIQHKGTASTIEELKFMCSLNKYLLGLTMCPEQVMVLGIYQ